MKKFIIGLLSAAILSQYGCSKAQLDKMNTNPTQASAGNFDPNYLLSNAQFNWSNPGYSQLLYQSTMMQVLSSTLNYYGNGDKYINAGTYLDYQGRVWNDGYTAVSDIKEMQNLANQKGAASYSNLINIGDIMFVLVMQRVTDTYGDVPYSQAGQAKAGIKYPVYDSQQSIYTSMLSTLDKAITALDPAKDKPSTDLFYNGDITKWKKLGYSLMLRVAMRLTKVDPATAQTWAEKAAAGGTFQDITDNVVVKTDASNGGLQNANANAILTASDYADVRWSKTFIDNNLKATTDPRLSYIAEVPPAGLALGGDNAGKPAGDTTYAKQLGMPNGYDQAGGAHDIKTAPGYPGGSGTGADFLATGLYSRPRVSVYLNQNAPNFVMTYAETEFLLAEAKLRGWNIPGTAAQHYANGITGSLQSLAQLNSGAAVPAAKITAYVAAHPLDMSSLDNGLKAINTQYWISTGSTFEFFENWFNWKRSGYPVLTPVVYPGNVTNGTIPRRIPYLSSESINNTANYKAAVSKLTGGDVETARTWWDK